MERRESRPGLGDRECDLSLLEDFGWAALRPWMMDVRADAPERQAVLGAVICETSPHDLASMPLEPSNSIKWGRAGEDRRSADGWVPLSAAVVLFPLSVSLSSRRIMCGCRRRQVQQLLLCSRPHQHPECPESISLAVRTEIGYTIRNTATVTLLRRLVGFQIVRGTA